MSEHIYIVSHSGPEEYAPVHVVGPPQEDWDKYCKSLMDEATLLAIQWATKGNKNAYGNESEMNGVVNNNDQLDALAHILTTKYGYRIVHLPSFDIGWKDEEEYISDEVKNKLKIQNLLADLDHETRRLNRDENDDASIKYHTEKADKIRQELKVLGYNI